MESLTTVEFRCNPETLNSPYYIARTPIEELVCQEITRYGSIIRIQAPYKMGITSLTIRLQHYAQQLGYRTVYLNFQLAEESVFSSLDKFLRWFCANISWQLELPLIVDSYWDEDIKERSMQLLLALMKEL
jgi:hypothetical protein